jgi:hypothetical protein
VVRFVKQDAPEITVEVFDMDTAQDAYGVFSHSRETEEPGIGQGYEYRGSLLCFWKGKYFVCVRGERETPESKEAIFKLAREIANKIPALGDKPEIVGFLPPENLSLGSVRFFHSHPSLNYHYFLAEENLLQLNDSTDAVIGRYEPGGVHLLCVQYPDSELARKGYDSFISGFIPEGKDTGAGRVENGKWVVADVFANYAIMVFGAKHEMAGRTLLEACKGYLLSSTE